MSRQIVCRDCGTEVPANGPGQRYCGACSELRDLLRKRHWFRAHPLSPAQSERNADCSRHRTELAREAGLLTNSDAKRTITWCDTQGPDLLWQVRVAVPFSYATSKNHIYTLRRAGHVALRREARSKRQEIAWMIRSSVAGRRVAHNKVWIDMLVQKPNHRGDAVNVVDLVCDALKDALHVDDRWFSIRRLDWEIVKDDPKLYIGVGQDSEIDCQVCSYCGRIQPLSEFNVQRELPLGVGRECRDCRRRGRQLAKSRRQGPTVRVAAPVKHSQPEVESACPKSSDIDGGKSPEPQPSTGEPDATATVPS